MKVKDPYKDNWEQKRNIRQAKCAHKKHWVKTCGDCGFVFDSDKLHEEHPIKEIFIDKQ